MVREAEQGTPLRLDDDELVSCVACGLCLPHCPTYRVTGLEIASPRGRIAAMRVVERGDAPVDDTFIGAMDACIQCRGCESACPSSVPFGHLMERTRAAIHDTARRGRARRLIELLAYRALLPNHMLVVASGWVLAILSWLRLAPRRLGLPRVSFRSLRSLRRDQRIAEPGAADGWLFTGCVMDAWQRDTHRSVLDVADAMGVRLALAGRQGSCCGALHLHAGRVEEARRLAHRVISSMPGDAPIVVDSAGCGASMKGYGSLLGTEAASAFSRRVVDFAEWVDEHGVPDVRTTGHTVIVQDPCHLRHVQHAHDAVRAVLAPAYDLVEIPDDGLCCGAGGAYSVLQRDLSSAVRDRKVAALRSVATTGVPCVASANPGCSMHLSAAGIDARHPADLLAAALVGADDG